MHMLKKENLCRIRKIWHLHLKYFYKKYVQNLKYNVKRACLSLDFGWNCLLKAGDRGRWELCN